MPQTQPTLFKTTPRTRHGGGLEIGKRKQRRPLTPKLALHVTLRSQAARGALSLLHPRNTRRVQETLQATARRNQVRVYQYANSGNHLHLLVRGKTREGLQNFFRTIGSKIAQLVTGAKKGQPFGKFWENLLFTRLVSPGGDFNEVSWYILKNELEAEGWVEHDRNRERERIRSRNSRRGPAPPLPREWS